MPKSRRHYRIKKKDVLRGHAEALEFGGLDGIRDEGLIESAIARPYSGYHRSIERKTAALAESLAMNHAFIDGNKRTALYMMELLLRRSGYRLATRDLRRLNREVESMILAVVAHRMQFDELVAWFKRRIKKAP